MEKISYVLIYTFFAFAVIPYLFLNSDSMHVYKHTYLWIKSRCIKKRVQVVTFEASDK